MEYISVKQTAKNWNIDVSRVNKLARQGRIEGAIIVARNWLIPKNAKKPIDKRTKVAKLENKSIPFRFPLFVNFNENDFNPPLNDEEKTLRLSQLDFYACEFDKAKIGFENLLKNTKSIYIKIIVLFYLCSLSVEVFGGKDFKNYYHLLQISFVEDFPHKKEMEVVIPWLHIVLAQFSSVSKNYNLNFAYDYSPTVLPILYYLSFYYMVNSFQGQNNQNNISIYELLCRQIENNNSYYESCEAHLVLFSAYYIMLNQEMMMYHLKKGLDIAKKHNLPLLPASYLFYYPDAFDKIENDYPKEYIEKIKKNSRIISQSFSDFTEKNDITKIYSRLSSKDYRYILFTANGYTNKQIAEFLNISERTVNNKYYEIYNKLGIFSKQELIKLLK